MTQISKAGRRYFLSTERASYDHLSSMREVINAALAEHGGTLEDMSLDAATVHLLPNC